MLRCRQYCTLKMRWPGVLFPATLEGHDLVRLSSGRGTKSIWMTWTRGRPKAARIFRRALPGRLLRLQCSHQPVIIPSVSDSSFPPANERTGTGGAGCLFRASQANKWRSFLSRG